LRHAPHQQLHSFPTRRSSDLPGTYVVTISKQGFTVFKIPAQKIDLGASMMINASLKVGSTSTTVEVTASAGADLQTTNATVGNTDRKSTRLNSSHQIISYAVF